MWLMLRDQRDEEAKPQPPYSLHMTPLRGVPFQLVHQVEMLMRHAVYEVARVERSMHGKVQIMQMTPQSICSMT